MNDLHPIPAEWLSAYYDGELDATRTALVEEHLPGCEACQHTLAELKLLSGLLAEDTLADDAISAPHTFWQAVEPQLPEQEVNVFEGDLSKIIMRWLPGLGLLLMNGLVQVAGVAVTVWLVLAPNLPVRPNWMGALDNLAVGSILGLPAWLLPMDWINVLGGFALFVTVSAGLAVLYLAWLGYELRYGTPALARVSLN